MRLKEIQDEGERVHDSGKSWGIGLTGFGLDVEGEERGSKGVDVRNLECASS